jgi:2Fe-2S ferredoxin
MPRATYIDPTGNEHTLEGDAGTSLMDLAVKNGVPGIVAECGGFMNCASCHVYVDQDWTDRVGGPSEDEVDMLEGAMSDFMPTSRLSCQVPLSDKLDGVRVTIAPEQF